MQQTKITVTGIPASKGSYRPITGKSKKTGRPVTRLIPMDRKEKPWRKKIVAAIHKQAPQIHYNKNLQLILTEKYLLPRPKTVKPKDRITPNVKPDIDKLQRAAHDALTDSGIIADDSQIIAVYAQKQYCVDEERPGLELTINAYTNQVTNNTKENQ